MGAIADHVATMRGCSLAQIVAAIAQMEDAALDVGDDDFAKAWAIYPHKVAKPAAKRAYVAARKRGTTHQIIMAGIMRYVEDKPPDRPWLNFSTFANQERWNDQPAPVSTAKPSKTSELRNDLSRRIGQGSEDTRPLRQLSQRQPLR